MAIPIRKMNDRLVVSNSLKNESILILETDSSNGKEVIDFLNKHK